MPGATGDFIDIAGAIGARLGHLAGAWRCQVVLEEALQSRALAAGVFFPPGDSVLQVNRFGMRAVNETRNYNDRGEVHGVFDVTRAEYPNQLMFMVYDQRTAEAWLANMDRRREQLMPILASTYGADQARKWWVYWRVFFMSCAELFGYRAGSEWIVSHYLFRKPA